MPNVVIYSADYCPYCRQARALLDRKGVSYTVLRAELKRTRPLSMLMRGADEALYTAKRAGRDCVVTHSL